MHQEDITILKLTSTSIIFSEYIKQTRTDLQRKAGRTTLAVRNSYIILQIQLHMQLLRKYLLNTHTLNTYDYFLEALV